jgi:hypothetical protein
MRPLTIPEARSLHQACPNLFRDALGNQTVDLTQPDHVITLALQATHVQVNDTVTMNNCMEWAVGIDCSLEQDLDALVDCCEAHGWRRAHPGAPNARVDVWGVGTNVLHGTRRLLGNTNMWSSVMGMGSDLCVAHARFALAPSGYGGVIMSFESAFT